VILEIVSFVSGEMVDESLRPGDHCHGVMQIQALVWILLFCIMNRVVIRSN
jgi:hypothetical protein